MKSIKTIIGIALCSAMVLVSGCSTLTSLETSLETWLNSPATQSEISAIASWALQFAAQYLASLTAASPTVATVPLTIDSPQIVNAQAAAVTQLQALYPDAPQFALQVKVHDAFVAALAQKGLK
jgi:hypothetical protein